MGLCDVDDGTGHPGRGHSLDGVGMKFSQVWDKLKASRRAVGVKFTTMRKFTPAKFEYYKRKVESGRIEPITYKGRLFGKVRFLGVSTVNSKSIPIHTIQKDTYRTWTREDFDAQLRIWYDTDDLMLIVIEMEWVEVKIETDNLVAKDVVLQTFNLELGWRPKRGD